MGAYHPDKHPWAPWRNLIHSAAPSAGNAFRCTVRRKIALKRNTSRADLVRFHRLAEVRRIHHNPELSKPR
ncbi:hypothetical protein PGTUg99_035589 [Puccinia graminis f. sp. tritici]|uniref:Uncharacterized protein n=1 Tax=Puccinia graminis f. sp. tritici TaxID=56615 RepID=A0A5B0SEM8_PUCGR|nr:hypothetical protein PGTUg99_035589 [Puccinia graminis f. sp. tritici]